MKKKIEKARPQNMLDFRVGLSKPWKLTFLEDKISYLFFTPEAQEYRNEKNICTVALLNDNVGAIVLHYMYTLSQKLTHNMITGGLRPPWHFEICKSTKN